MEEQFKVGDKVRIKPKVDVYGMMGRFVNKTGTIKEIKHLNGGYEVAEIDMDTFDHDCIVQTKHLEKIK